MTLATSVPTPSQDADTGITPGVATGAGDRAAVPPLLLAFSGDPVIRWIFPEPVRFLEGFAAVVGIFCDTAAGHGAVDTRPDGSGAAVWLRPGAQVPADEAGAAVARAVDPRRLSDVAAVLEAMDAQHPSTPHWYLPFVGVDPRRQGEQLGSALLRAGHARSDASGLPAYLEASSPRNRALYERHGYRVLGEIRVADCPPMWPMLRDPR